MKPEDISQEVLDSADGLWTDLANYAGGKTRDDETVLIARAIMAAEKRGEEREREACAKVAESVGPKLYSIQGHGFTRVASEVESAIAAAIRNRSNPS